MIIVLMGVCGCGKTTVGRALAQALGWSFHDADDFHPPANVAKMTAGQPLTDDDRWPWLASVAEAMQRIEAEEGNVVLACSALRQAYRERLARAGDVRFVHLQGDFDTISARLAALPGLSSDEARCRRQTIALAPVIARPTISVFTSRVPSSE